ncbi:hypothetical protein J7L49_02750, partial [Candidatus Bathyarchaeota archaeon]|nr:hypothetical protein [Candidatus Bathyarchaeota archaeon]
TYIADIIRLDPKSKTYSEVIDVYETGTERGGRVRRVDKETGEPIEYQTYGPKAIATRFELPFTAKCIRIITEEAPNKEYSKRRHQLDFDPEWPKLVNLLLKSAIKYWPEVVEAYNQVEQTDKLTGRPFNYWAPLLAICKVFAPQHYSDFVKLAEEIAEFQEKGDRLSEVEDAVLAVLLDEEIEGKTATLLLKDLTEKTQLIVPWVKTWHIVKSALDNLGIVKRRYETKKGVAFQIDLERVKSKAKVKGITAEVPENNQNPLAFKNSDLSLTEVISQLKTKFTVGTELDFEAFAEQFGLNIQEANSLFWRLVNEGELARTPEGYWRWVK